MKIFRAIRNGGAFEFYEYIAKCLAGVIIGYLLLTAFPEQKGQFFWVLISILLSITPDNNSKIAFDRMRGNVVGSMVGLFTFLLHNPPNLLTICVGVVAVIAACYKLKLEGVCRTALVAFVIVLFYEGDLGTWLGAIYRMGSVTTGCLIGLFINFVFRRMSVPVLRKLEGGDKGDGGE